MIKIKGFTVEDLDGAGLMVLAPLGSWQGAIEALCIGAKKKKIIPVAIVLERLGQPPASEPEACFPLWGEK